MSLSAIKENKVGLLARMGQAGKGRTLFYIDGLGRPILQSCGAALSKRTATTHMWLLNTTNMASPN